MADESDNDRGASSGEGAPDSASTFWHPTHMRGRTDTGANQSDATHEKDPDRTGRVVFRFRDPTLTPMAIKGVFLTIITLGIYRFWFVTNLRRHFWSLAEIDESPLEYNGRAVELLIGFLIALAIFVPVYLVFFIWAVDVDLLGPASSIIGAFIFALIGQFAVYRAYRYRIGRTRWRGIPFSRSGSGWKYTMYWFGSGLVVLITAGLALPWHSALLERHKMNHTRFGSMEFRSTATGRSFLKPFLTYWVLVVLPIAITIYVILSHVGLLSLLSNFFDAVSRGDEQEAAKYAARLEYFARLNPNLIQFVVFAPSLIVLWTIALYPYFWSRRMRAFLSAIELEGVVLRSDIQARPIYKAYVITIFLMFLALILIFIGMYIVGVLAGGLASALQIDQRWAQMGVVIASYLLVAGTYIVMRISVIERRIWWEICRTMTILNIGIVDNALRGSATEAGGINEGMADALDVGGGFEIGL